MPETIPLFPLGSVLFPGVVLPLHIFEERYRELVRALSEHEDSAHRRFGVVAIRQGWEVGQDAVRALHRVGTIAVVRQVSKYPDGRYDIVTVGMERFRLLSVDPRSRPYLMGEVEPLPPDPPIGDEERLLARSVATLFEGYVDAVAAAQQVAVGRHELPEDVTVLSYLVASAALFTLEDRQAMLEAPDVRTRLRGEVALLKRETTMVHALHAVPAPLRELQIPFSPN